MTQLSQPDSQFDRFLFATLYEVGETPLSVLSALTRQDIDAWQEAARLACLPKDRAVNSLAATIWKSNSERLSAAEASITAARLVALLPSQDVTHDNLMLSEEYSKKLMMWLVYGVIFWSVAISSSINRRDVKDSNQPNHINAVVGQQAAVPPLTRGISTD
jgi:hypothetical protein